MFNLTKWYIVGVAVAFSYPIPEIAVMIGDKVLTGEFNQEVRLVKTGSVKGLQVGELVDEPNNLATCTIWWKNKKKLVQVLMDAI